jgi:hypothetical protein
MYVCFNDECPLYIRGKNHLLEKYGQAASYRYMVYPDTGQEDTIVAVNPRHMEARLAALKNKSVDENIEE